MKLQTGILLTKILSRCCKKRMKQSGQRWSMDGAQNMLNLRVTRKNLKWLKIIELTKSEFKTAA